MSEFANAFGVDYYVLNLCRELSCTSTWKEVLIKIYLNDSIIFFKIFPRVKDVAWSPLP